MQKYDYKNPAAFLRSLRELEMSLDLSGLDYKKRSLHTRKLRRAREQRHTALFTYGMAQRLPEFSFDCAVVENADYDAVIRWRRRDECVFTPLQLKELYGTVKSTGLFRRHSSQFKKIP